MRHKRDGGLFRPTFLFGEMMMLLIEKGTILRICTDAHQMLKDEPLLGTDRIVFHKWEDFEHLRAETRHQGFDLKFVAKDEWRCHLVKTDHGVETKVSEFPWPLSADESCNAATLVRMLIE